MARQRGVVVPISATDNTERAFQQVNERIAELQARVRAAEAGASGLGRGLGDGMGHAVPQIAAASGAIREFEGNLPIRAVERFLTATLGLGPVLAAAFPIVGAIAFVGVVGEGIEKLYALYKTGAQASKEIDKAFEVVRAKLQLANDELDLQNAKLQQQIDKIEGHPNNGVAEALAEAKVQADKLLVSLQGDITALDELLKQHEVGTFSSLLSGVASNKGIDKDIKNDGDTLAAQAADATHKLNVALSGAGTDKDKIAAANKAYFDTLDKNFGDFIKKYQDKVTEFQKEQDRSKYLAQQAESLGGARVGSISAVDNSANIAAAQAAVRDAQLLQDRLRKTQTNGELQSVLGEDKANKVDDGKAEKLNAALKTLADAQRKAQEQAAQQLSDAAKRYAEEELAALDDKHTRQLISDREYYAQRATIQEQALAAEADAITAKQAALEGQVRSLVVDAGRAGARGDAAGVASDQAKVVELHTQINALEEQRLALVQKRADIATKAGTEDYLAAKKAGDEALKTAAELEAIRGGSTSARLAQSQSEFSDKIRALRVAGGDTSNLAGLEGIAGARIGEQGANSTYQDAAADLSAKRSRISTDERNGLISAAEAQREKVELDRQEAAALQPLIQAYQHLADLGVEGAKSKVDELNEKVYELQNPVDQVSARMRSSFDSAFQNLFDNLDRGQKAFQDFGKSINKILLDSVYKQFVQPGIQAGLGALIPNKSSALAGLIPGLAHLPGVGVKGAGAGDVTVQIINQGSPVSTSGASSQMSGGAGGDFEEKVISIILKDAETNGSAIQAIIGAVTNA
jgi:hypothetical protein